MENYEQLKCDSYNESLGYLTGYDCNICNNKGHIMYIGNDGYTRTKDCECMKKRKLIKSLEETGISLETFNKLTLDSFETSEDYQKVMKNKAIDFINSCKNTGSWFFIGSITGIGKTHLCTAIFKSLLDSGNYNDGIYFPYRSEMPRLRALKRSYGLDSLDKFEMALKGIKTTQVLYIDDLFKGLDNYSQEDINTMGDIIDYRYGVDGLITIISSEYNLEELEKIDGSICGRIYQKSKGFFLQPTKDPSRNYRLKK